MRKEIEELNSVKTEYYSFKDDIEIQIDNYHREIELNKSMLEMLNKEMQILNSEKSQLEKRFISNRWSSQTPVIIEEEESELAEEERLDQLQMIQDHQINGVEEWHINTSSQTETDKQRNKQNNDKDVAFLQQQQKTADGILILNKQIEDMTFYIDEIKSELEVEKEKNCEYLDQIQFFKDEREANKCEPLSHDNFESFQNSLILLRDQVIKNEKFEPIDCFVKSANGERMEHLNDLIFEIIETLKQKFNNHDETIKKETQRSQYLESQMEKVIKDFKQEIIELENNLKQKTELYDSLKTMVMKKIDLSLT
jgi:hypothetical protein